MKKPKFSFFSKSSKKKTKPQKAPKKKKVRIKSTRTLNVSFFSQLKFLNLLVIPAALIFSFFLGALVIHYSAPKLLEKIGTKKRVSNRDFGSKRTQKEFLQSKSSYKNIENVNVFCPGCPIPDLASLKKNTPKDCSNAQRMSGGPMLVGTIALTNPEFSVATINTRGKSKTFKQGENVQGAGEIFEIRTNRVCFLKSDELFFIELPKKAQLKIQGVRQQRAEPVATNTRSTPEGIESTGDGEFEIKRSFLIEQLQNSHQLLRQAKAVPHKNADGDFLGFKITNIERGSIFEALINEGDVLTSVNGEPLNIARAQELFSNASDLEDLNLSVIRNGQNQDLNFKVK